MDSLEEIFYSDSLRSLLNIDGVINNQAALKEAIEAHDPEIEYLGRMIGTGSFNYAFEDLGQNTIYDSRTHPDLRVVNAHVTLGDNAPEDITVRLLKNGKTDIAEPLTLKATEKRGKVQIFTLFDREIISQYDSLIADLSTPRRVVVAGSVMNTKVI